PEREATAADARREPFAEALERRDAAVEILAPAARKALPVAAVRRPVLWEGPEGGVDPLEWDPGGAARLDERDPPQHRPVVAALVAVAPACRDQPFRLVEAERRGRDTAACRDLADRQLGRSHLT